MNSTGYVKSKRGNVFQPSTGKLFIFDDNSVSVLRGWPVMRAWKKTCVKHPNWIGFRPSLNWLESELRSTGERMENYRRTLETGQLELPLGFRSKRDGNPYNSDVSCWYFETTPRKIRDLLNPFGNSRWALMSFLAAGGTPAQELLQSAPALAFMLANNRVFHSPKVTRPLRAVRCWMKPGKKRRELAGWLGFPPTPSTVHLLEKIPAEDLSIPRLLKIRELVQWPRFRKMLCHMPVIDRAALCLLDAELRDLLTPALLNGLREKLLEHGTSMAGRSWQKTKQPAWILLRDTARMFRQQNPDVQLPEIPDLRALYRVHDGLSAAIQRMEFAGKTLVPPVPGNEVIIPITDYAMLCAEGEQQHNCAASYAQDILAGKSALYRVLAPERCTLELVPQQGKWCINQLLAANNQPVQTETKQAVSKWLTEIQQQS